MDSPATFCLLSLFISLPATGKSLRNIAGNNDMKTEDRRKGSRLITLLTACFEMRARCFHDDCNFDSCSRRGDRVILPFAIRSLLDLESNSRQQKPRPGT